MAAGGIGLDLAQLMPDKITVRTVMTRNHFFIFNPPSIFHRSFPSIVSEPYGMVALCGIGGRSGKLTPLILLLLFSNCLRDSRGINRDVVRNFHLFPLLPKKSKASKGE